MQIFTQEFLNKVASILDNLPQGTYMPASNVAKAMGLSEEFKLLFPFILQSEGFKGRFESVKAKGIRKKVQVNAVV